MAARKAVKEAPKKIDGVTPHEVLPLLEEAVEAERNRYLAVRKIEQFLGAGILREAELRIFDLTEKAELTIKDAAGFLEIVRRENT